MTTDWLGNGFRFPVAPFAYVTGLDLVRQSIGIILDTEPGERIMLPAFGCGLRRHLMAPNSAVTRAAIQEDVTEALTRWEPRIRLTNVAVTPGDDPALVWIDISWVQLLDQRPDNLVYPFYLR
ncbi:GPW/gp25 family protein [Actinoplanes sp. HUAS TT8]|uniref:GPW/gp25 family protein n=1 Tax=Actinoplanes sp. HUAS TT8 TaxID=3447453 RepID=UPI003F526DCC